MSRHRASHRAVPLVRDELPVDVDAVRRLNVAAFETDAEARLVDALRARGALTLSLVAELDGEIVGHIAFSPIVIDGAHGRLDGVGLGPMAVSPAVQRRGIGGALIAEGLRRLRGAHRLCVVLGHADYYPRHGFERASLHGLRWERPAPDDVFFVHELTTGGLRGAAGVVRYRPEFDEV